MFSPTDQRAETEASARWRPTYEVLNTLQICEKTLRAWSRKKLIPAPRKFGRRLLWDLPGIQAAMVGEGPQDA